MSINITGKKLRFEHPQCTDAQNMSPDNTSFSILPVLLQCNNVVPAGERTVLYTYSTVHIQHSAFSLVWI